MSLSFKPRREFRNKDEVPSPIKLSDESNTPVGSTQNESLNYQANTVLTENSEYIVLKNPSGLLPSIDGNSSEEEDNIQVSVLNAASSFGLILTKSGELCLWNLTNKLQLGSSNSMTFQLSELLPKNISINIGNYAFEFVANSMKLTPGLLILNKHSGEVYYYEDIQSMVNVNFCHFFQINLQSNECIVQHEYITGTGLLVVTNAKQNRMILVSFKDSMGKLLKICNQQSLSDSFLGSGTSKWNMIFNKFKSTEIRCVHQDNFLNKTDKLLTSLDSSGNLTNWIVNRDSHSKNAQVNIYDPIVQSVESFYPYTWGTLEFLTFQKIKEDVFMVVSKIQASLDIASTGEPAEYHYIVSILMKTPRISANDQEEISVLSTYKLKTIAQNTSNVKLYVDYSPEKIYFNAFIAFENSVVMLQLSTKFDSEYNFQEKWEDIILFKSASRNLGYVFENSQLVFINSYINHILTIQFKKRSGLANSTELYTNMFIKTHIEQSIYFNCGDQSPIEFNLPDHIQLEREDIENDLRLAIDEVWNSQTPYLPQPPLGTDDKNLIIKYVHSKLKVFERLIKYVAVNFNETIDTNLKLSILYKYEILNCAFVFYDKLNSGEFSMLLNIGNESSVFQLQENMDFFPHSFEQFIRSWNEKIASNPSDEELQKQFVKLVVNTLYETVFEKCESKFKYEVFKVSSDYKNLEEAPWFSDIQLVSTINDLVLQSNFLAFSKDSEYPDLFMKLIKILYYQCTQYGELSSCDIFVKNHLAWCDLVLKMHNEDFYRSLILMLDFYKDLSGLAYTFDRLSEDMIPDSVYIDYLSKYGEEFIKELCKYFIESTGNLSKLFRVFKCNEDPVIKKKFSDYLNTHRSEYSNVAWIDDICNEDYSKASETLFALTTNQAKVQKFQSKQFELSVAKLALLLDTQDQPAETLPSGITDRFVKIQIGLDELNSQKDLFARLKTLDQDFNEYTDLTKSTEFYNIAVQLINNWKKSANSPADYHTLVGDDENSIENTSSSLIDFDKSVLNSSIMSLNQLIFLFTILTKNNELFKDGFFCALKLLALSIDDSNYEIYKFYLGFIWRAFLMMSKRDGDDDDAITKYTLDKYFEHELYRQIPLPLTADIYDKHTVPTPCCVADALHNINSNQVLKIDCNKFINENLAFIEEITSDSKIQNFIKNKLPTYISESNYKNGDKVIVDYKSGKLQFN